MADPELESFKTRIDLRDYAAAQDYQLDRRESWRGSSVMRHPVSKDKLVIKRDTDDHYVYFSFRNDRDNGSIVDFVQHRRGLSLGAVRKELRPWIGQPPLPVPTFPPLKKTGKDRMKVEAAFARMEDAADGHPYLERERALPRAFLGLDRFAGRIKIDDKGNAVFPHFDADGLSGYELKNVGFTGFASGGSKALWLSHEEPFDTTLVFTESAIDALSFAVLFPDSRTRYASVGGKLNPEQSELILAAIRRMPKDAKIIAAMDADVEGAKLADIVCEAFQLSGREDLTFVRQDPVGFKDWNDQLRGKSQPSFPCRPAAPSVA